MIGCVGDLRARKAGVKVGSYLLQCAGMFDGSPESMLQSFWSRQVADVIAEQRAILADIKHVAGSERVAMARAASLAAEAERLACEQAAVLALEAEFAGCTPAVFDLDSMVLPSPCGLQYGKPGEHCICWHGGVRRCCHC